MNFTLLFQILVCIGVANAILKSKGKKPAITTTVRPAQVTGEIVEADIVQDPKSRQNVATVFERFGHNSNQVTNVSNSRKTVARVTIHNWLHCLKSEPYRGSTTEQSNGGIRLDRQKEYSKTGVFGKDVKFKDFQLQINSNSNPPPPPQPSTIAHVQLQQNLVGYSPNQERYIIARALDYSLQTGGTVMVYQQVGSKLPSPRPSRSQIKFSQKENKCYSNK